MRILHLGKYYPPVSGGIETVTRELVEGQAAMGHEPEVLAYSNDPCSERESDLGRPYRVVRTPVQCVVASSPVSVAYVRALGAMSRHSDIIHVHVPNPTATLGLCLARPKAPVVVHWHSDIVRQRKLLRPFLPFQRWLLDRADLIVGSSEPYVRSSPYLARYLRKVTVIPYGVRPLSGRANSDGSALVSLGSGKKLVLSVGRLVYYKGYEHLIGAAACLPDDYIVAIVGEGPMHAALQDLVQRLGCAKKVMLLGWQSAEQVAFLMEQASCFCLPSVERSEAFGVVQLEAMSAGVPVVATTIVGSGTSWVNQDGYTGRNVAPGNPDALVTALREICEQPGQREKFAVGGRQRYAEEFSVIRMVERMERAYHGVLESPVEKKLVLGA